MAAQAKTIIRCAECGGARITPYDLLREKDMAYTRGMAWAFGFHAGRDFGRKNPGGEVNEEARRKMAVSCGFRNGAEDSYTGGFLRGQEETEREIMQEHANWTPQENDE